ncbi:MAG: TolC family protein [Ignavibacteriales bacterium]|nr:TolC family protein [Ignavibacteriales bacterium]
MKKSVVLFFLLLLKTIFAQHNLEFFLQEAYKNNPQLKEFSQSFINTRLERELINAENVLPKISLTANYLFAPFFNNNGKIISTNPGANAIGYDVGITNGGLYSAQINLEKNLFNGYLTDALEQQILIKDGAVKNNIILLKHELEKQVTDIYLQTYLSFKLLNLENEILSSIKKEESIAAILLTSGLLKESEILLLKIEVDNQTNAINNSTVQFRTNLNQLLILCDIKDTSITQIDSVELKLVNASKESFFNKKFENDSLALLNQQTIFESKYQPQVSLFFNTGLNAIEIEGIQRKFGLSAGINFSMPIFDGNQKSITRQQNDLSLKSISFYKEYFSNQLNNQRKNSLDKIQSQKNNLNNLQNQIKNYEKVILISESELKQGNISMVDYLTILKNFIELKKNFITVQFEYQSEINSYNYWNW